MGKRTCELCGHEIELEATEEYHIVPGGVREQAGIQNSRAVRLCPNCHDELLKWYSARVATTIYDAKMKRFKAKPPLEMAKEYEAAYRMFAEYKNRR
jgi:hypothetical protein